LAFAVEYIVIYGLNVPEFALNGPSKAAIYIYGGFHRLAWAMAVGWVVFACCRGYGGKFVSILKLFFISKNILYIAQQYIIRCLFKLMQQNYVFMEYVFV